MRIDEFSGSFDGSFSSAEKIRFISVGFDIVAAVAIGSLTKRTLSLIDKDRTINLIDKNREINLIDKDRSLVLI